MMKTVIIFALLLGSMANAEIASKDRTLLSNRGKFTYPISSLESKKNTQERESNKKERQLSILRKIKYHILNGNLSMAQVMLRDAVINSNYTKSIQLRYIAIIHFIKGEYAQTLKVLNRPAMQTIRAKRRTCMLKSFVEVITDHLEESKVTWDFCKKIVIRDTRTQAIWFDTIMDLKNNIYKNKPDFILRHTSIDNESGDYLRMLLKLALYLNKQDLLIPRFKYFGINVLKNVEIRELIGLSYYRNGNLARAYQFLEDLETPNASVFKGNLFVIQNKYQKAYGAYKLALLKKNDSTNALERIIPLTWNLKKWDEGAKYLKRLPITYQNNLSMLTLLAAFKVQNNKHKEAQQILRQILLRTHESNSIEVSQLTAYNSIILDDQDTAEKYSESSCIHKDAISCWSLLQFHTWNNFNQVVKREENIHENLKDLTVIFSQNKLDQPINERAYVKQKNIEEMDDALINLVKH